MLGGNLGLLLYGDVSVMRGHLRNTVIREKKTHISIVSHSHVVHIDFLVLFVGLKK